MPRGRRSRSRLAGSAQRYRHLGPGRGRARHEPAAGRRLPGADRRARLMSLRVLVTRPAGQETPMMTLLAAAGFTPLHQSTLCIAPRELDACERGYLMNLDLYHAVFLVSTNAVRLAVEALSDYWPQWPVGVCWIAVGEATARALAEAGLPAQAPASGFNSEAVLTLPALQSLDEKQ